MNLIFRYLEKEELFTIRSYVLYINLNHYKNLPLQTNMQAPIIQQDHEENENNIDRQTTYNELNSQLKLKAEIRSRIDQYLKLSSLKID